jgi:hypothetical protein
VLPGVPVLKSMSGAAATDIMRAETAEAGGTAHYAFRDED